MNLNLSELMQQATRLTKAGQLKEATAALLRGLSGRANGASTPVAHDTTPPLASEPALEGCVVEVETGPPAAAGTGTGEFTAGVFAHAGRSHAYKLFVPPGAVGCSLPLVVMLHGCTQDPSDFAAGTAMNERAAEQGFFVLYPAQAPTANPARCWNWFKQSHQRRGGGEPAWLAALTLAVVKTHTIDAGRVYVAGLSAGGAMAAIVAAAYPEIFAAAGVHSGLARGAASDVAGALAAMKTGAAAQAAGRSTPAVPTIVFHGGADSTVHPLNGEQVVAAALGEPAAPGAAPGAPRAQRAQVEQGVSTNGRQYTRRVYASEPGQPVVEHWLVHGAGHAWAGGQAAGTYTDPTGPDATREMLRFFFAQPRNVRG